jgi:hypothetical protein
MTPSPQRRRVNRQHFARTPDLYHSRPEKRFTNAGFGPWLLVAVGAVLLFGIVLVIQ